MHVCARKADGSVWCWGYNHNGELGDGTFGLRKPTPVQVGTLDAVTTLDAAGVTCAGKADGTYWCWGVNFYGELGDGTTVSPQVLPVHAIMADTATLLSTGGNHACALRKDGTLWCWGANGSGELGNGAPTDSQPNASQVTALGTDVVQVSAGHGHTCAIKKDRTVWCWGWNELGQIGDGTTTGVQCLATVCRPLPVQVSLPCP